MRSSHTAALFASIAWTAACGSAAPAPRAAGSALCAEGPRTGACDALRKMGRVPEPPPEPSKWSRGRLLARVKGCFRVVAETITETFVWPWTGEPEAQDAGTESPSIIGTLYCFADDRYFVRPDGGAWDEVRASWSSTPEGGELRNDIHEAEVRGLVVKGDRVIVTGDIWAGELRRLPPSEAEVASRETAALPRVEEVCTRALRCAEHSRWGYDGGVPVSLRECLALEQAYSREAQESEADGEAPEAPSPCR